MQNIKSFNESKTPKAGFLGGVICLGISLLSFAAPSFAQDKSGSKSSYTKLEKPNYQRS